MDSSIVNREIKSAIRPALKNAGFTGFTARNAWRYSDDKIDVVNFGSFNSYNAGVLGCTTYSFEVHLGCSFKAIPSSRIMRKNQLPQPREHECHFRRTLRKGMPQPNFNSSQSQTIWYVEPSGENLLPAIADAKEMIVSTGLAWFDRFNDLNEVLRTLLKDDERTEDPEIHVGTWGFGRNPSPSRHFMTGFVASSLGETELAANHIRKALESRCFREFEARMRGLLEEAKGD